MLIPLKKNELNYNFSYLNSPVTKVKQNGSEFILFGIPYSSNDGLNIFVLKSNGYEKTFNVNVQRKNYFSQNININKFKKKSKDELNRIYKEKLEMIEAKKNRYNNYPDLNFIKPLDGIVTGVFGTQRFYNGKKGKFHNGHDLAAPIGTPIKAPSGGKVMLTGHYYYNGKFVMLDHGNGLMSIFLHMDDIHVSKGSIIKKDHVIGTVGNTGLSTGPHLHWSVMVNNVYVDPLEFIDKPMTELDN